MTMNRPRYFVLLASIEVGLVLRQSPFMVSKLVIVSFVRTIGVKDEGLAIRNILLCLRWVVAPSKKNACLNDSRPYLCFQQFQPREPSKNRKRGNLIGFVTFDGER